MAPSLWNINGPLSQPTAVQRTPLPESGRSYLLALITSVVLLGCSAKSLDPAARQVELMTGEPAADCAFLGSVAGQQGNWFTAPYTANFDLIEGARNELTNNANELGANAVYEVSEEIVEHDVALFLYGSEVLKVNYAGEAYQCSELSE